MPTDPITSSENANDSDETPAPAIGELPTTTPAAHEATEQVEAAGQAVPVTRPVNDTPAEDFIGTRRLTDNDTGSRMTI